ncbi:MAG: ABC transporter ATP-binding protein/permease, partial [Clostridia bacterium]|nr:ABC transporter ATP-binding protein/permease [Clostridia bacterium]
MKKRGILSRINEFAGPKRINFAGSVILAILGVAASFIPYLLIADIVKQLLAGNSEPQYYVRQVALMAVAWILRILFHNLSTTLSHVATFNVLAGIRKQLCEKLSKIPLGSVLDDNSGSYKNIIVERVDSMETTLAHIIPEFTANILLPMVMFVYLLTIDWRIGLSNLISVVIGLVFAAVMMMKSKGEFEVTIQKTKYLNDTAVEYINGIEVIKAFGKTGSSYEKFVNAAKEGADCFIRWMRKCIWWQAGMLAFMPATFLGVLPVGLILVKYSAVTPADFITCVIISAGLITPLVVAFSYMDDMAKVKSIFGEAIEILDRPEMKRPENIVEKPQGSDICLEDVRFTYKDKEVLHGINMEIKQGMVNAMVGPSGSGKSTIARLIDSLWDPDSGTVKYGGVDIKKLPLDYYMGQIAYVAQDNYLFDMSVRENIRLGNPAASDEDVINAAKAT